MPALTIGTIRRLTAHLPDDAPVFPSWDPDAPEDAPQIELLGFGVRSRTPKDPVGLSVVLSVPADDEPDDRSPPAASLPRDGRWDDWNDNRSYDDWMGQ